MKMKDVFLPRFQPETRSEKKKKLEEPIIKAKSHRV